MSDFYECYNGQGVMINHYGDSVTLVSAFTGRDGEVRANWVEDKKTGKRYPVAYRFYNIDRAIFILEKILSDLKEMAGGAPGSPTEEDLDDVPF